MDVNSEEGCTPESASPHRFSKFDIPFFNHGADMDAGQCIAKSALEFPYYFYGNGICGGRDREAAEGSMKHQFHPYI